jgi:glycosyltransferase involved in cell wall biosynthesis
MDTGNQPPAPNRVSVVIPCYNQAGYLGQAIESVLAQTCQPFEVVVVDDGSTDNTVEVARSYGNVRCVSQRNQGQGAARNEGFRQVSGEFVVFLDADDRLLPNACDVGLRRFADHPGVAFVAGRCIGIGPDGVRRSTWHQPVVKRNHYLALLRNNYIWTPGTVMFRTEVVRRLGGFKTTVCGAEDYDLYLRIARNHEIWCHEEVVVEYREHDNKTSGNYGLMLSSSIKVIRGQRAAVRGDSRAEQAWRHGLKRWQQRYGEPLVKAVRGHWRDRNWRRAAAGAKALLLYHPSAFLQHASRKLRRVALGHRPERLDTIG